MTIGRIPSVEGGIQPTIFDAKADILTATAADTPARLAVGANDLILTAASGEATGLKYTGAWTTWTPIVSNVTVGNGTVTARYVKIGKAVTLSFRLVFGSTTTISGSPNITLPFTSVSNAVFPVWVVDTGTAGYFGNAGIFAFDYTKTYLDLLGTAGAVANGTSFSATVPFTWTTNDEFFFSGTYEVA